MLSIIGLSLDVVGAVVLVIGLFGHTVPSGFAGPIRRPEDVAHDTVLGVLGGLLLVSGFVFQSLPYFDVNAWASCSTTAKVVASLLVVVGASVGSWLAYGLAYPRLLRREEAWEEARRAEKWEPPPPTRLDFFRFWNR